MKAASKVKAAAGAAPDTEAAEKVTIPPTFTARINHMAQIKGKAFAATWRESTLAALQKLADEGASIEQISAELASINGAAPDAVSGPLAGAEV